jgi:DNA-directed RNA polymerase specialized sigma24 family protein
VLGNQAEAEDALQDVFVKIWRNADRYQVKPDDVADHYCAQSVD